MGQPFDRRRLELLELLELLEGVVGVLEARAPRPVTMVGPEEAWA